MNATQIDKLLEKIKISPSKWELDNIIYFDRTTNPKTLFNFLQRIKFLQEYSSASLAEQQELGHLVELLDEIDDYDIEDIVDQSDDDAKDVFLENLARISAIEVLTDKKVSFETMTTACKLSPTDFIICAKRTQDLINSIRGLVIKGETLSQDVAGA